jgi:hypothetical protein
MNSYQRDAVYSWFIVVSNISTCFGHHSVHLQESKWHCVWPSAWCRSVWSCVLVCSGWLLGRLVNCGEDVVYILTTVNKPSHQPAGTYTASHRTTPRGQSHAVPLALLKMGTMVPQTCWDITNHNKSTIYCISLVPIHLLHLNVGKMHKKSCWQCCLFELMHDWAIWLQEFVLCWELQVTTLIKHKRMLTRQVNCVHWMLPLVVSH